MKHDFGNMEKMENHYFRIKAAFYISSEKQVLLSSNTVSCQIVVKPATPIGSIILPAMHSSIKSIQCRRQQKDFNQIMAL